MARRPDDSGLFNGDENLFRINKRPRRDNDEETTKLSNSQTLSKSEIYYLSIESSRSTKHSSFNVIDRPEIESIGDNDSINEAQSNDGISSLVSDSISSAGKNGEATKLATEVVTRGKSFNETSKHVGESSTIKFADTVSDCTNFGLSEASIKFANGESRETSGDELSGKKSNRPLERIHFSTPEVEKKWRNIVEDLGHKRQKLCESEDATEVPRALNGDDKKNPTSVLSSSGKRSYSEVAPENRTIAEEKAADSRARTDGDLIALLGPIPSANSRIFEGMSFVLERVSLNFINPQQLKAMRTNSEAEYLEQWTRRPFVRHRLIEQINAAGGKSYEKFELVPADKYPSTKLIMNIPHITEESLLCLSVGIEAYSHQWIIRSCQENKIVNPAEERLPAGWSVTKQSYVEMYQRPSKKPFLSDLPFVVVIPMCPPKNKFVSVWERIIGNSGGAVLLVEDPEDEFMEGTVVLIHDPIPAWVIQKAKRYDIPLVTTRWAVQCLIEGQICDYDAHPSFEYNAIS